MQATIVLCFGLVTFSQAQIDLAGHFANCHKYEETFDNCIQDGLNALRPYFKTGLPDYGIGSFDPFFAEEVPQKVNNAFVTYKLVLRNVTEEGWTNSEIKNFTMNFDKNYVEFSHFFPDKRLNGWYEMDGKFLGTQVINQGTFSLRLVDYAQTMKITRKPIRDGYGKSISNPPIKTKVNVLTCRKLELHIGHLFGGRTVIENVLDRIINTAWAPGFILLRPLINDLVSTAFTKINNDNFQNFPLEQIFHN